MLFFIMVAAKLNKGFPFLSSPVPCFDILYGWNI